MRESLVKTEVDVIDLIRRLDGHDQVAATLGSEEDSWVARITWNADDIFKCSEEAEVNEDLSDFIDRNTAKKRLVIGYVSYDYGYLLQGVKINKPNSLKLPYLYFCAYDNFAEKTTEGFKVVYKNPTFLDSFRKILDTVPKEIDNSKISFEVNLDIHNYEEMFNKTKRYIKKGHAYQLNLTNQLGAKSQIDPESIISRLASKNLAKMMSYFDMGEFSIMSMSPERFIRTLGRHIETMPIKGTGRRKEEAKDKEVLATLLANEKERSELSMITDLLRNDLSKVCEAGSVRVELERGVQKLSKVIHTYSKIAGTLEDNLSPMEALLSMSPGGSITGCPKKRAMEIIDELEPESRGIYCGSMIMIDPNGDLDSSILIRTIVKKDEKIRLQVGGGIVFDSILSDEYQEGLDKAYSLEAALN